MAVASLLSILTASEKRKDTLLLLHEKPRTLSEIKEYFIVRSPEILPRLKEMEAAKMILRQDGLYSLAPLGKVAAMYYRPLLGTLDAIEANGEFWGEHDLSVIPEPFLTQISALKECRVLSDTHSNIFDTHDDFVANTLASTHFNGFTSIFMPSWPDIFLELAREEIPVSIIVTEGVYNQITKNYSEQMEEGLKFKNAHLYVHDPVNIAFASTDLFFTMSLYLPNGIYDPRNDLVGSDPSAIKWGDALFNYFKETAIEIKGALPQNEFVFGNEKSGVVDPIWI